MILDHSLDLQILYRYFIKPFDYLVCRFMKEIPPLVGYLLMPSRKYTHCLLSVRATALFLVHLTLSYLKIALCLAKVAWVLYCFTSRESGEILDANIDANALPSLWDEQRLIFLNCENHEPTVNLFLDRDGFNFALYLTREPDSNAS